MSEPIRFYKGEETGIVHESYSDINTSLFKDQYIKALNEIGAYLEEADMWSKNHADSNNFDMNNIFAFVGDRGAGKTSSMESVADILEEYCSRECEIKHKFFVFDTIDPTTFDNKSNILEVVIGALFEKFRVELNESNSDPKGSKEFDIMKDNVIGSFQDVKDCIKYLFSSEISRIGQSVTKLSDLASVIKLHDLFGDLIKNYLKFFGKDVLVIKIDDIDLQTRYAYKMVEQIRKYFIQYNVIVLFAVKLEQLSYVIELENTKNYDALMDSGRIGIEQIKDIATKYIIKLIPTSHRIYLPTVDFYVNSNLDYYSISRTDAFSKTFVPQTYGAVKYAITALIYNRCRFLFYHTKGEISPIVPRNLRELRYLFALLVNMPPYDYSQNTFDNKEKFKNYFNNLWVSSNIAPEDYDIVNNINSIKDASVINRIVLRSLDSKFNAILKNTEYSEVMDVKNASYNISIADVFSVMDYVKHRVSNAKDKMLLFYIETFYSMKLYEYYDELTEGKENIDESDTFYKVNKNIKKREVVEGISNYECLVGGRFLNTDYYSFTPADKDSAQTRDKRKLDLNRLREETQKILDANILDEKKLQIVEFFALCTSRIIESSNVANKNYRQTNELYYTYFGKKGYDKAQFDLGAFFFNIIDVKRAYDRINVELFNKAVENEQSLYNIIKKQCWEERKKSSRFYNDGMSPEEIEKQKTHAILSCATIRNYEILDDFLHTIEFNNTMRSPSSSNSANIKAFFNRVADYRISTYYDVKDPNDVGVINFYYASKISDILSWDEESEYEQFFESIYLTDKFEELRSFDVTKILTLFNKYPVAPRTLKSTVYKYCKTLFEIYNIRKQDWLDFVVYMCEQYNWDKISKSDVEMVLLKFASKYSISVNG